MKHRLASFWVLLLTALLLTSCGRAGAPAGEAASNKPYPSSSVHVGELRSSGIEWTNGEIRAYYLRAIAAIAPANERWKAEGVAAEERARRAFATRHDARVTARAMMKDPAEVRDLERRDQEKYGHPDGPTFDDLVAHQRKKGLVGDAVFEAIVASAQRTDRDVNEAFGLSGGGP